MVDIPLKGWTKPEEVIYCDVCSRRAWVWELHHLEPMEWGGSRSRAPADRQVVWIRVDGDCHATTHMILDQAKKQMAWPEEWLLPFDFPHLVIETARRGWQRYMAQIRNGAAR